MVGCNAIPALVPCVFTPQYSHTPYSRILSVSPPLLLLGTVQGVPPATVAEWTLQGDGNKDFYDGARVTFLPFPPHPKTSGLNEGRVRSIRRGWVQHPDDDYPFCKLFRRLVSKRPESWMPLAAHRPT